jgi:hydroxymethylbilane synthase
VTRIRLATRGSAQATTQAQAVADRLAEVGIEATLVIVDTHGDRTQSDNVPLHSIGGLGVFTKEVQNAVLDGHADAAVHSAKDLPTEGDPRLTIAAFTTRRDSADAMVGRRLGDLTAGATVATGSVRRRAQLRRARPDLQFEELRGNIHTRLERIPTDGSIVMAAAALEVLGLTDRIAERLDPFEFVPAVGQGCVAVDCGLDDRSTREALDQIDDARTRNEVEIERAFLAELGSGCALPVGAHVMGDRLAIFLASEHSTIVVSESIALTGDRDRDVEIAVAAADEARRRVDD